MSWPSVDQAREEIVQRERDADKLARRRIVWVRSEIAQAQLSQSESKVIAAIQDAKRKWFRR